MNLFRILAVSQAFALTALCAQATPVNIGQPLLVADVATSGSTVDNFGFAGPTTIQDLSVSAEISAVFGANPALIGETISLFMGPDPLSGAPLVDLTIAGITSPFVDPVSGFATSNSFGSIFTPGVIDQTDGVIGATFLANFPYTDTYDPIADAFIYAFLDPFAEFSDLTPRRFPEVEFGVNIYYNGNLPSRTYEETDIAGNVIDSYPYYDGLIDIDRIEFGVVGGPPVPVPTIPLPATLPLFAFGLGILGLAHRRKS